MADSTADARLSTTTVNTRKSRRAAERSQTENRVRTDADRLAEFRGQHAQAILPKIPQLKGYHVCWLTTNNPRDSIQSRQRMGYEPIHLDEVGGAEAFKHCVGQAGSPYEGLLVINEMVAFKIPQHLYDLYMREAHHNAPRQEEHKITERAEALARELGEHGSEIGEGGGIQALRNLDSVPTPEFADEE